LVTRDQKRNRVLQNLFPTNNSERGCKKKTLPRVTSPYCAAKKPGLEKLSPFKTRRFRARAKKRKNLKGKMRDEEKNPEEVK